MGEIKRGLAMMIVPVAVFFLTNTIFVLGNGITWAQSLAGLLFISNCFLGGWSIAIGLVHFLGGVFSLLKQCYLARTPHASPTLVDDQAELDDTRF